MMVLSIRLTELFDVVCFPTRVLLELLLQHSSVRLEEVLYRMLTVVVLFSRLQWLESSKIFLAGGV